MRLASIPLLALLVFGCAEGDSGIPDASRRTIMDAGEPTCDEGRTLCGEVCVDTSTDVDHCGGCDTSCAVEQACVAGECTTDCGDGLAACGEACVDTSTDRANCGSCGTACAVNERCEGGSCVPDCAADETACGGICADLQSDPDHCGSCGNDCAGGELCSGGECKADCDPGLEACGSACVDPDSDVRHCGSCDNECAPNETCSSGSCACPTASCGGACCAAGQGCLGGACCDPTWKTRLPGVMPGDVAVDADGTVYVAGTEDETKAYLASLDPCGSLTDDLRFVVPGSEGSGLRTLALGDRLYVGGVRHYEAGADNPQDAMYAAVRKSPLTVEVTSGLWGGTAREEVTGIAVAPDGRVWTNGTSHFDTPDVRAWGVKIDPGNGACGWPIHGVTTSYGRDVVAAGGDLYYVGSLEGELSIDRFLASSCSSTAPCGCEPGWSTRVLRSGSAMAEARAIVVDGSTAFVAGFEDPGSGDLAAVLASVSLETGEAIRWGSSWNPSSNFDLFLDLVLVGSDLYAVGAYDVTESLASTTGFITKARTSDLVRSWTTTPTGIKGILALAADDAGGLVVVGSDGVDGYVMRCLPDGTCP